jgi:hypothetical protein
VYEDSAVISLGRLDLTGVSSASLDLRSEKSMYPFSLELRADGLNGELLGKSDVTPTVAEQWYKASIPVRVGGERALYIVVRSSNKDIGQFNPLVKIDGIHFERGATQ